MQTAYDSIVANKRKKQKQKKKPVNPAASWLGKLGGKARVKKMSKEELRAASKKAAEARWAKEKPPQQPPPEK